MRSLWIWVQYQSALNTSALAIRRHAFLDSIFPNPGRPSGGLVQLHAMCITSVRSLPWSSMACFAAGTCPNDRSTLHFQPIVRLEVWNSKTNSDNAFGSSIFSKKA